ncbi:hypothetical protein [Sulfuricurvum sp.]|uniref:hypothetical protein n=1 Tax=Sulfuricurvum sp. TaxID=2025608 RepID=UPI00263590B6|nr:hypothetical protein [Sulfuricurvum sp.]MDD4884040.1 hypothetical protein [Sulfuricurvum sp.]
MESDLKKLKELCGNNKLISQIIESLHNRQDYAIYHCREYEKITELVNTSDKAIRFFLSNDVEIIALKANIMACLHNMHITHDLLGQLICRTLNLKIQGQVYLRKVVTHLNEQQDDRYRDLVNLLNLLAGSTNIKAPLYFQYLVDIVNHSKHRFTIEPKCKTNLQGQVTWSCYFEAFTKDGRSHNEMDAIFFINTEYNREAKLIIQIENELINILEIGIG